VELPYQDLRHWNTIWPEDLIENLLRINPYDSQSFVMSTPTEVISSITPITAMTDVIVIGDHRTI